MSFKDHARWAEMRQEFDTLSNRVKELSQIVRMANDKLPLYNQLLLTVWNFDNHLRLMIKDIPEYYTENKEVVDDLLSENINFMTSISDNISSLSLSKSN